ncbi:hypothetical protein F4780DRAFT_322476 [Xylariomycetidae sp. FL0641]|nr:hypothetical protein F4780DRAFT_322476 [Xylariomycetidae sp. FL0641]
MRPGQTPPPALLALLLSSLAAAAPYPRNFDLRAAGFGYLEPAPAATAETTAPTVTPSAALAEEVIVARDLTTTWTETRTYTSTISSWNGPTTTAIPGGNGENCVPEQGTGQIACGVICCADWQYCAALGQCSANVGVGTWSEWTTIGVITTQFSAPYRVTSGSTIIATETASETTTTTGTAAGETQTPSETAGAGASTTSDSDHLSGGAIAGIVVGTLAGIVLLALLCFCCIARGLWAAFAGLFGKKDHQKKERIEVIEERYSRHNSAYGAARRPAHRTWFGGGGRPHSASSRKPVERKEGGGFGWLVAGAGALAILLGLRRHDRDDHKRHSHDSVAVKERRRYSRPPPRPRSDWSSSYYTDSYTATTPSEFPAPRSSAR